MDKTLILDGPQVEKKIDRIAYQIYEDNYQEKAIIIAGIADKGYLLSEKIVKKVATISNIEVHHVKLTVDKENPLKEAIAMTPNLALEDKVVILVDDVLNSGQTLIYGVKYLLNFPVKKISTAVLIDRNYKRYPIGTQYVGLSLSTTLQNHVSVEFLSDETLVYIN